MRVTGINHVGLNAAGKASEVHDFYRSFVGLGEIPRSGAATLVEGFWFGLEVPLVHVITDPAEGPLAMPNGTHLALFVADIDEAVAQIKARTDEHLHIGEGRNQIIWMRDPAGNTVEFQQDPSIDRS